MKSAPSTSTGITCPAVAKNAMGSTPASSDWPVALLYGEEWLAVQAELTSRPAERRNPPKRYHERDVAVSFRAALTAAGISSRPIEPRTAASRNIRMRLTMVTALPLAVSS